MGGNRYRARVLALHGMGATPALWNDVAEQAPDLSLLAPDVSTLLQAVGGRLGCLVRALSAIVPAGPVTLTGCGVGANVALELGALLGDRLRGVLLLSPQPLRPHAMFRERYRQLAKTLQTKMTPDELLAWTPIFVSRRGVRADKSVPQAERMLLAADGASVALARFSADFPDAGRTLQRVRAPVRALFAGDNLNPFHGPRWVDDWRRSLGPENVELLPEARHWLPLEAPEEVALALRGFESVVGLHCAHGK